MFKDAIYRILIPIPKVQTHLLFKGPAKSGKSVVEGFLRELILGAKHAMHIGDFSNSYMLANSKDKRLCTLSEVHSIDPKKQGAMKAFTAHDVVSSQIKFVQSKVSFRPYGLMILTTNHDPFEVFKSAELMDRFFVLEFVRANKTDIQLIDRFRENMLGLVNWALATDHKDHLEHVRSSQINIGLGADQNIYTRFIGDHLIFDKNSYCTVEAIASCFNEFKEDGARMNSTRAKDFVMRYAESVWNRVLTTTSSGNRILCLNAEDTTNLVRNDNTLTETQKYERTSKEYLLPVILYKKEFGKAISRTNCTKRVCICL